MGMQRVTRDSSIILRLAVSTPSLVFSLLIFFFFLRSSFCNSLLLLISLCQVWCETPILCGLREFITSLLPSLLALARINLCQYLCRQRQRFLRTLGLWDKQEVPGERELIWMDWIIIRILHPPFLAPTHGVPCLGERNPEQEESITFIPIPPVCAHHHHHGKRRVTICPFRSIPKTPPWSASFSRLAAALV